VVRCGRSDGHTGVRQRKPEDEGGLCPTSAEVKGLLPASRCQVQWGPSSVRTAFKNVTHGVSFPDGDCEADGNGVGITAVTSDQALLFHWVWF
jgi:hypothetical protein